MREPNILYERAFVSLRKHAWQTVVHSELQRIFFIVSGINTFYKVRNKQIIQIEKIQTTVWKKIQWPPGT